jgi:hypothetical protein
MQLSGSRVENTLEKFELPSTDPEQIRYNEFIADRVASGDTEGTERIEDALNFAIWLKKSLPNADVLVSSAPVVIVQGHTDVGSYRIHLGHGSSDFSVNQSPFATLPDMSDRVTVGRELQAVWKMVIRHLPTGFVIYGPDVTGQGGEGFEQRERMLTNLGFGATDEQGDRFGIVKDGEVTPYTRAEFDLVTGGDLAVLYNQRFMAQEIIWTSEA